MSEGNYNSQNGRFLPGNKAGLGHVLAKKHAAHRREWLDASTPEERAKVRARVLELALTGDGVSAVAAIKVYNEMTYGKSEQTINLGGGDGDPVKLDLQNLTTVILTALGPHPEARQAVARALRSASQADTPALEGATEGAVDGPAN